MFSKYYEQVSLQRILGLLIGIGFGFFLQKGGATNYDVIIGQLLLTDFTVLKLMLTAVIVGMLGIHLMKSFGWIEFHTFFGSIGASVIGGLIFGVGFALLGYCPGTVAGAIGQGQLDALIGGGIGILIGTGIFAKFYPTINDQWLDIGRFPAETIPELTGLSRWVVVVLFMIAMIAFLLLIEYLKI
jgi:hypothetical protein